MKKNFTRTLYRLQARLSYRVNWRWLNNWKTLTGISLLTAGGMAACRGETSKRTSATFIVPEENVINDDTDAQITTDTLSRDDVFCYVTEDEDAILSCYDIVTNTKKVIMENFPAVSCFEQGRLIKKKSYFCDTSRMQIVGRWLYYRDVSGPFGSFESTVENVRLE